MELSRLLPGFTAARSAPRSLLAPSVAPGLIPGEPLERVELSSPRASVESRPRHSKKKLVVALAGIGMVVGGLAAFAPHPPPDPSMMVGYSGDAEMTYGEVAEGLVESADLFGSSYDVRDLQVLAGSQEAPEASRLAAQEVLADPILLTSMDVAGDPQVNRQITLEDLNSFAAMEPDSGAFTFSDLESHLQRKVDGTSAFEYFDTLGGVDDQFGRQELERVVGSETAPETFREVAEEFLEHPNLFNGFDVAEAAFSPKKNEGATLDGVVTREDVKEVNYSPTPEPGNQWTSLDRDSLQRIAEGGELSSDLFTAFRQTDRGNCVTTAVIKAAMDHYGGRVLESFQPNDVGGYDVAMRDGYELRLTGEELEAGATGSHYADQHNDTKSYANLLYTAAAKRAQLEGHEGAVTFSQALLSLNNGEGPRSVPHFLGLGELMEPLEMSEVIGIDGAVVYGGGHAYYVDTVEGETLGDRWGKPTEYQAKSHVNSGEDSTGAYIITG